jgi:hypothetical protein
LFKYKRILLGLVALTLLFIGLVLFTNFGTDKRYETPGPHKRFETQAWINGETSREGIRKAMLTDLMKRHHLIGMRRAEIDALMGPPTITDKFRQYDYVYWLGPDDTYMPIDSTWLCLKFENGTVSRVDKLND